MAQVAERGYTPTVPSPLNPTLSRSTTKTPAPTPAAIQREHREKKETLKKRESGAAALGGHSTLGKRKANASHAHPSPQRFNVPPPRALDFEPPKEDLMVQHEPTPFMMRDGEQQLYKPIDLAENKKGYRYSRSIADPLFPHKQYYRSTSPPPHYARLSFEDADKWMHFTPTALITTNEKGWRMTRSNMCAREGTLYYEVKIHRGVPAEGPIPDSSMPEPHVRFGWARREAPLDAPVGFDGYSYGVTDIRFEPMHRSRPGKFFQPKKPKPKGGKAAAPLTITLAPEDQHVKEGDVIGLELQLPSLALHQKVVSGIYNPAVDTTDGFDKVSPDTDDAGAEALDVIRDRIPVPYKGNSYFEILDYVATRPMEVYTDRATNLSTLSATVSSSGASLAAIKDNIKTPPHPNHEQPSLRTLPHSAMRVYKNGRLVGTAFENLLAFLPPASQASKLMGAREGFDDGLVGYFPAVSCFWGGIAEVNFGDGPHGFWAPPAHLQTTKPRPTDDVTMQDSGAEAEPAGPGGWQPGRTCRPVGERYTEQIAEDVVWDVIDEVDFFMQDGGFGGQVGSGASAVGQGSKLKREE